MGKIVRLSTQLSNMIAAGEVVERPLSVVKELVENAIDAKSTKITVSLEESGTSLLKVTDDGCGMSFEDCEMAFMRHATSKIKNEYDLFRINTLGFRGEAIPSIASVSYMQIITNDGTGGYQVSYKAGSLESKGDIACNIGTTVIVKNLFFNTPARLKYLKSLSVELSAIIYLMERFAISNPKISFSVTNNSKEIFNTSGLGDLPRLFGELYGFSVAKNLILSEYIGNGYKIKFVLAKPEIYRSSKMEITIIANGRYVKSYLITNAIIEGYLTNLPINKFPIVALYLEIDPLLIDVNVHPTKTQIKISNEQDIASIITRHIRDTLDSTIQIPQIILNEPNKSYEKNSFFSDNETKYEPTYIPNNNSLNIVNEVKIEEQNVITSESTKIIKKLPYMEYVGQVHGTYLIFQNENGLYLIDQHAAAERINYENYYNILGNENFSKIQLLLPFNFEFSSAESIYIYNNLLTFKKIGFDFEESGINSFFLREIPFWANIDNAEEIILYALKLMIENKEVSIIKFRNEIAKEISCKASIKANHFIDRNEIDDLIINLNKCDNPYHCPHGRPTIIKISNLELEQMFKRSI